jgi:hypothetical protein
MFPSSGVGGKTLTQLGPLERTNLNHWIEIEEHSLVGCTGL